MQVRSEVSGNVWLVEVEIGQAVSEGDTLIVIESMKMEIPVAAPADGTVREIRVGKGDAVTEDEVVVVMA